MPRRRVGAGKVRRLHVSQELRIDICIAWHRAYHAWQQFVYRALGAACEFCLNAIQLVLADSSLLGRLA